MKYFSHQFIANYNETDMLTYFQAKLLSDNDREYWGQLVHMGMLFWETISQYILKAKNMHTLNPVISLLATHPT